MDDVLELRIDRLFQAYKGEDGFLTRGSFVAHVDELARRNGASPDDERPTALRAALAAWWEQLQSAADTDGDGRVSRAELGVWVRSLVAFLQASIDRGDPWPLDPWIDTLYAVIDADGDGIITLEEYRMWLQVLHLDDGWDVESAFSGFDTNHDGHMSRDEFGDLTRDYWTNFDASIPAHRWLGP